MRAVLILIAFAIVALIVAVQFDWIRIDQTRQAEMPRIEGGKLPEFKADTVDIDVGTVNRTIEVPKIKVRKPEDAGAGADAQD